MRTRRHWLVLTLILASPLVVGCGSAVTTVTERATPAAESTTAQTTPSHTARSSGISVTPNPAQQPDPHTTAGCDEVPLGHACHAVTATPSDPNTSPQRNCDANIVANSDTSCAFAENAFYEYYEAHAAGDGSRIGVYSPTTHQNYELDCTEAAPIVGCTSDPIAQGIYVSFSKSAVAAYTSRQASAYATSRDVGNPPSPSSSDENYGEEEEEEEGKDGSESESGFAGSESESGGEDELGSYSHTGDASFCSEHECIGDFEGEDGYVVECEDETYSHAGGKSGACSDHGGIRRRQ